MFFFFWMSMESSCKSLTYNIYTLFCIIHLHLHTQSQKASHLKSGFIWTFWGFAVQRAKTHLHTFETWECWRLLFFFFSFLHLACFMQLNPTQWLSLTISLHWWCARLGPLLNNKPSPDGQLGVTRSPLWSSFICSLRKSCSRSICGDC